MDEEERQMYYDYNMERVDKQFYIDRHGKVHKYLGDMYEEVVSIHSEIAYSLYPDMRDPAKYLMECGWILVGSSVYNCPIIDQEPSDAQLDTLEKLGLYERCCIKVGEYYPKLTHYYENMK